MITYLALHVVCGLVAAGLADDYDDCHPISVFIGCLLIGPIALGNMLRDVLSKR